MKKTKKILALALATVMLVSATVAVTVAYLTSTDSVTNTFAVGKVKITLDELPVDLAGVPSIEGTDGFEPIPEEDIDTFEERAAYEGRKKLNDYKLIPGHEYVKDPIVHVDENSEKCYLFVTIVNEIEEIENEDETVLSQMDAKGWVEFTDANGNKVFKYENPVDPAEEDVVLDIEVFERFVIADDADLKFDATGNSAYAGETIVVTAYAVQFDGFATAEEAWNAAYCA